MTKPSDRSGRLLLFRALSLLLSTVPVAVCTLLYFPLWREGGPLRELSGFAALLLVLSALPLYRLVRRMLRSPSVWVMWLFAFLLFLLLSKIADEMTVISFTGLVGNAAGALLWKIADRRGEPPEKPEGA